MQTKRYGKLAVDYCRAALARGPLKPARTGKHYSFGGRLFNAETINALIESGEAVRVGGEIRRAP